MASKITICVALMCVHATARGDEATLDLVRREYPKALAELESRYAHCRGAGEIRDRYFDDKGVVVPNIGNHRRVEFAVAGSSRRADWRAITETRAGSPYRIVAVKNATYDFLLEQASKDGPLLVEGVGAGGESDQITFIEKLLSRFVEAPFRFETVRISELLRMEDVDLVDAVKEAVDGRELMRIEFTKKGKHPKLKPGHVFPGTLWVSPDEGWVLRKYEFRQALDPDPKYVKRCAVEYDRGADGALHVKSARYTHASYDYDYKMEEFSFTSAPAREFTFAFYGLPDIARAPERRRGLETYHIFLAVGAVLLAAAIGLRYYGPRLFRRREGER